VSDTHELSASVPWACVCSHTESGLLGKENDAFEPRAFWHADSSARIGVLKEVRWVHEHTALWPSAPRSV
jgi:hypothetical protein